MDKDKEETIILTNQIQQEQNQNQFRDNDSASARLMLKREQLKAKLNVLSKEFVTLPQILNETKENRNQECDKGNQQQNNQETNNKNKRRKKKCEKVEESNEQQDGDSLQNVALNSKSMHENASNKQNINQHQKQKVQTQEKEQIKEKNKQENQGEKKVNENQQANKQVNDRSNKNKIANRIKSQLIQQQECNPTNQNDQNLDNTNTRTLSKGKLKEEENTAVKESKANKKGLVVIKTEKEKQKKQGYYSKINYNLSEIIQNQTIPIKLSEKNKKEQDQDQQDATLIQNIEVNILGKNPAKNKNKALKPHQISSNHQEINYVNNLKQEKQTKKNPLQKQSQQIQVIEEEETELDKQINQAREELNKLKQQSSNNSGWDAVILSEKELKELDKKMNLQKAKLNDLELMKDLIIQEEQNNKQRLIQEQQERKKQRHLRKLKRLGHLKNIAKEIALFKKAKGIPHPRQNRIIKYKAVPDNQLDFELIEKKKKKVSKIKTALKTFKQQQTDIKQQKNKAGKLKQIVEGEEDYFETVNEDSELEDKEDEQQHQIKDKTVQSEYKKGEFKEDVLLETKPDCPTIQTKTDQVYKLPSHINENNNLEGFKYNNMYMRAWVDHIPLKEIDDLVLSLVNELSYKQAMKKLNDPKKFKKRIVAGFKEVLITLNTSVKEKKSKCVIISLNLECNPLKDGSDQLILEIINLAVQKKVPIIYSSSRARLGKAFTGKFGPRISVLSVLNYEGLSDQINELEELVNKQKQEYAIRFNSGQQVEQLN